MLDSKKAIVLFSIALIFLSVVPASISSGPVNDEGLNAGEDEENPNNSIGGAEIPSWKLGSNWTYDQTVWLNMTGGDYLRLNETITYDVTSIGYHTYNGTEYYSYNLTLNGTVHSGDGYMQDRNVQIDSGDVNGYMLCKVSDHGVIVDNQTRDVNGEVDSGYGFPVNLDANFYATRYYHKVVENYDYPIGLGEHFSGNTTMEMDSYYYYNAGSGTETGSESYHEVKELTQQTNISSNKKSISTLGGTFDSYYLNNSMMDRDTGDKGYIKHWYNSSLRSYAKQIVNISMTDFHIYWDRVYNSSNLVTNPNEQQIDPDVARVSDEVNITGKFPNHPGESITIEIPEGGKPKTEWSTTTDSEGNYSLENITVPFSRDHTPTNIDFSSVGFVASVDSVQNNDSFVVSTLTILPDQIPPEIGDATTGTPTTGDPFDFEVNVTDNVKEVENVSVEYWFDSHAHKNVSMNKTGENWTKNINISTDAYELHYIFHANDTFDNWNSTPEYTLTVLDDDLPQINVTTTDTATTGDPYNITANVTDNRGDPGGVWVDYNMTSNEGYEENRNRSMHLNGSSFSEYYKEVDLWKNATFINYTIVANDTAEDTNWNESSVEVLVSDNDGPEIYDTSPSTVTNGTTFNVTADITDNQGGVDTAWLNYTLASNQTAYTSTDNVSMKISTPPEYYREVFIWDNASYFNYTILANDTENNWNWSHSDNEVYRAQPPVAEDDFDSCMEEESTWTDVLANDSDSDGSLNYSTLTVTSVPSHGSTTVNTTTGEIEYVATDTNYSGSDSYIYEIADDDGATDTATVSITVNEVNDAPWVKDDSDSCDEEGSTWTNVTLNDEDDNNNLDYSSITVTSGPSNGAVTMNGTTGEIEYVPDINYYGTDTYTYEISDGAGLSDTADVTITINEVNDPPKIDDTSPSTVTNGTTFNVTADITDNQGGVDTAWLNYTLASNQTAYTSTDNVSMKISTPPEYYREVFIWDNASYFNYTILANDTENNWNWSHSDNEVYHAQSPIAEDDFDSCKEEGYVWTNVTLNDTDDDGQLNYSSLQIRTHPDHGAIDDINTTTGEIKYIAMETNYSGSDSYVYEIADDDGATDTATVTITINEVNDAPWAKDDSDSCKEDGSIWTNVTLNDEDDQNNLDHSSLQVMSAPAHGTTNVNSTTGEVEYIATETNYSGTDSYTYEISDGDGLSDTATVEITINEVNDAPWAKDDSDNCPFNGETWTNVTVNDIDDNEDLDLSTLSIINGPSNGAVNVNTTTGEIKYTPNTDYTGSDSYTYEIADGDGATDTATVSITVNEVNEAPSASDDSDSCGEEGSTWTDVLANDEDDMGLDPTTLTVIESPDHGTTTVDTSSGEIEYVATETNYSGTDSYIYQITDGDGATDTATVTISVNEINDPPWAKDDSDSCDEEGSTWTNIALNDIDDNDDLDYSSITVTSPPAHGTINLNGTTGEVEYTATETNYSGTDSYTYEISDGDGATDTATVTITINEINDAPWAKGDSIICDEESSTWTDVLANDEDDNGLDLTTLNVIDSPEHGTTNMNTSSGEIEYVANETNYTGTDSYTYEISDGDGLVDNASVSITIHDVNDPPIASFDCSVDGLTIELNESCYDCEGELKNYSWSLDDGEMCYEKNPEHTYKEEGTYEITLNVTDEDGAWDKKSTTVEVTKDEEGTSEPSESLDPTSLLPWILLAVGTIIVLLFALMYKRNEEDEEDETGYEGEEVEETSEGEEGVTTEPESQEGEQGIGEEDELTEETENIGSKKND